MQEHQVNEEFDAARASYLARREAGRSATCRMRKPPAPKHAIPVSYQVDWEFKL